jgi:hypothetical protein
MNAVLLVSAVQLFLNLLFLIVFLRGGALQHGLKAHQITYNAGVFIP